MDINKTKAALALALGLSGTAVANTSEEQLKNLDSGTNSIVALSGPDIRVTVYDGIATIIGDAVTTEEAMQLEDQIASVDGVDYVINLVTTQL